MPDRSKDIAVLLAECQRILPRFQQAYRDARNGLDTQIDALEIPIKHYLHDLRTCLEYLAHDIHAKYCPATSTARFYFPVIRDRSQFERTMERCYPGLRTACPDLYAYLESLQPFVGDTNAWLAWLSGADNRRKHDRLLGGQATTSTQMLSLGTPAGVDLVAMRKDHGSLLMLGNTIATVDANGSVIREEPLPDVMVTNGRVTSLSEQEPSIREFTARWVSLDGHESPADTLLEECLAGVRRVVADIEPYLK